MHRIHGKRIFYLMILLAILGWWHLSSHESHEHHSHCPVCMHLITGSDQIDAPAITVDFICPLVRHSSLFAADAVFSNLSDLETDRSRAPPLMYTI